MNAVGTYFLPLILVFVVFHQYVICVRKTCIIFKTPFPHFKLDAVYGASMLSFSLTSGDFRWSLHGLAPGPVKTFLSTIQFMIIILGDSRKNRFLSLCFSIYYESFKVSTHLKKANPNYLCWIFLPDGARRTKNERNMASKLRHNASKKAISLTHFRPFLLALRQN